MLIVRPARLRPSVIYLSIAAVPVPPVRWDQYRLYSSWSCIDFFFLLFSVGIMYCI